MPGLTGTGVLSEIPLVELMKLWGELVECYHGVHFYAGESAQIYAYRLMRYRPTVVSGNPVAVAEESVAAGRRLLELVNLFCAAYEDAQVRVDGKLVEDYWQSFPFDHRAVVTVLKAPVSTSWVERMGLREGKGD